MTTDRQPCHHVHTAVQVYLPSLVGFCTCTHTANLRHRVPACSVFVFASPPPSKEILQFAYASLNNKRLSNKLAQAKQTHGVCCCAESERKSHVWLVGGIVFVLRLTRSYQRGGTHTSSFSWSHIFVFVFKQRLSPSLLLPLLSPERTLLL